MHCASGGVKVKSGSSETSPQQSTVVKHVAEVRGGPENAPITQSERSGALGAADVVAEYPMVAVATQAVCMQCVALEVINSCSEFVTSLRYAHCALRSFCFR